MLIWYFSNNLDIYDYVGKLPEPHFSVWLFFNPGDKILLVLKFNEARISEWNVFLSQGLKSTGKFNYHIETSLQLEQHCSSATTDRVMKISVCPKITLQVQ